MKNIFSVLLLLMATMSVNAKFLPALLTYEDGSTKSGFVDLPKLTDKTVDFKATEDGAKEKLLSSDLKSIKFTREDGEIIFAESLFILTNKKEKGIKKTDKKYWLYTIYSDGMKIAVDVVQSTFKNNPNGGSPTGSAGATVAYIAKENDDSVFMLGYLSDMVSINLNMDNLVREGCEYLFKDCPSFIQAVNAENFKKPTLVNRVIELYVNNNCK